MVRARRANSNIRQGVLHPVQRNRRSRRLPHIIITLDNDIIPTPEIIDLEPTPFTINQSSASIPEIIEIDSQPSEDSLIPSISELEDYLEIQTIISETPIPTTSSTEDQYTDLEPIEKFPDYQSDNSTDSLDLNDLLAQRILAAWEHNATIASNPEQYNYSPEDDDFYSPQSYSPVGYDEVDTLATPLAVSPINIEIPLITFEISYTNSDSDEYILPELYDSSREE